jgi:hypothetical protein
MTLAEVSSPAEPRDRNRLHPHFQGWAAELGMTPEQASTRIAASPAWTAAADSHPAPEPEEPPSTYGRIVCQLTPFQLSLHVPGDPDFQLGDDLLDEDFDEWRRWDETIDREPEME